MKERFAQQIAVRRVPEIVNLSAGALIGEMFEHVKRNGYRHFFHGFGFLSVLDVGLDELCSRHGSVTRLLRRDKKLLPERIAVNKFMRAGRSVRAGGTTLAEPQQRP
jgi:hypothetical protein